jgi:DNA invertase Pin-like site-specific DNA recombinase
MDKSYFTSQQVKELLQLFTFENNKLELAKYAYRNTVDKRTYFIVNDVFSFGSSRDELARFIRDFR